MRVPVGGVSGAKVILVGLSLFWTIPSSPAVEDREFLSTAVLDIVAVEPVLHAAQMQKRSRGKPG